MSKTSLLKIFGRIAGALIALILFWSLVEYLGYLRRVNFDEPDLGRDDYPILTVVQLTFAFIGLPIAMIAGAIGGGRLFQPSKRDLKDG